MIVPEQKIIKDALLAVAHKMVIAARTAPKGRGADTFVFSIVEGDDIKKISEKLAALGAQYEVPAFVRDAQSILSAPVMVLFGSTIKPLGLKKCGMCGFANCDEKNKQPEIPCAFNAGDLGIAIGSAAGVAMDHRVDNRIMYTVGQAVMDLGLMGKDVKLAYAIPLSATSKNLFFDRK